MIRLSLGILLLTTFNSLFKQQHLPILRTNSKVLSIKDGDELRSEYWHVDSKIDIDTYVADKCNKPKTVTFYSDIDSISFLLKPTETYNFVVLLNGKDSCLTQLKSGILSKPSNGSKPQKDTLHFVLNASNNIMIEAIINQIDTVRLMFHTSENSVNLIETTTQKIKSLKFNKTHDAKSWGGGGSTRYSKHNTLQIGNFKWEDLTIWEDKHSGKGTDGKFGPNLFKEKIIEINYDSNFIVIHSSLPLIQEDFKKMDLIFKRNMMFIESIFTIDENSYKNDVLIHSGYGGTILFDDEFITKHQMNKKLDVISESQLKDSYGNSLKTKKAILPHFKISESEFIDIPISFFEGAIGRQKMSVLGCDLLKRFNLIFDLQNAVLYLKPNQFMDDSFG